MSWLRFGRAIAKALFDKKKLMIPTGESAPDFTLPGLDGKPFSLTALLRDGPALLVDHLPRNAEVAEGCYTAQSDVDMGMAVVEVGHR